MSFEQPTNPPLAAPAMESQAHRKDFEVPADEWSVGELLAALADGFDREDHGQELVRMIAWDTLSGWVTSNESNAEVEAAIRGNQELRDIAREMFLMYQNTGLTTDDIRRSKLQAVGIPYEAARPSEYEVMLGEALREYHAERGDL